MKVEEASDDIEAGYVIRYQDNAPGDGLEYGSTVTVVVSTGPQSGETGETPPAE